MTRRRWAFTVALMVLAALVAMAARARDARRFGPLRDDDFTMSAYVSTGAKETDVRVALSAPRGLSRPAHHVYRDSLGDDVAYRARGSTLVVRVAIVATRDRFYEVEHCPERELRYGVLALPMVYERGQDGSELVQCAYVFSPVRARGIAWPRPPVPSRIRKRIPIGTHSLECTIDLLRAPIDAFPMEVPSQLSRRDVEDLTQVCRSMRIIAVKASPDRRRGERNSQPPWTGLGSPKP